MDFFRQCFASILGISRPWEEEESRELCNDNQRGLFNPQKFGRSKQECVDHWTDIMSIFFVKGNGIRRCHKSFYREAGSSTEASPRLTETEAEQVIVGYFIWKKPINAGLRRTVQECEDYFSEFISWLIKRHHCSTQDLIEYAVREYYRS